MTFFYNFLNCNLLFFGFILFLGILFLLTSLLMILTESSVHSILYLMFLFLYLTELTIMLKMEFLALIFIIIYIGAVCVLMLFHIKLIKTFINKFDNINNKDLFLPLIIVSIILPLIQIITLSLETNYGFLNNVSIVNSIPPISLKPFFDVQPFNFDLYFEPKVETQIEKFNSNLYEQFFLNSIFIKNNIISYENTIFYSMKYFLNLNNNFLKEFFTKNNSLKFNMNFGLTIIDFDIWLKSISNIENINTLNFEKYLLNYYNYIKFEYKKFNSTILMYKNIIKYYNIKYLIENISKQKFNNFFFITNYLFMIKSIPLYNDSLVLEYIFNKNKEYKQFLLNINRYDIEKYENLIQDLEYFISLNKNLGEVYISYLNTLKNTCNSFKNESIQIFLNNIETKDLIINIIRLNNKITIANILGELSSYNFKKIIKNIFTNDIFKNLYIIKIYNIDLYNFNISKINLFLNMNNINNFNINFYKFNFSLLKLFINKYNNNINISEFNLSNISLFLKINDIKEDKEEIYFSKGIHFNYTSWIDFYETIKSTQILGFLLYNIYFIHLMIGAFILLIAMIGSIFLTLFTGKEKKFQRLDKQIFTDIFNTIFLNNKK
jgi:NADH:ubiquinone oxidoreductase subunit 6 (subunit J)